MFLRSASALFLSLITVSFSLCSYAADWPSYGGDNGSQKYSALDQINASNVGSLQSAWTWDSVDNATVANNIANDNAQASPAGYKATPIVIGSTM